MKRLVMDLDNTITCGTHDNYASAAVNEDVVEKMNAYREMGFEIVIATSRNMRTYDGNVGKIVANTVPVILDWLDRHKVPYDELWVGKPWCGHDGFYVDDKAIRPSEFTALSQKQVRELLEREAVL